MYQLWLKDKDGWGRAGKFDFHVVRDLVRRAVEEDGFLDATYELAD